MPLPQLELSEVDRAELHELSLEAVMIHIRREMHFGKPRKV